MRILSVILFLLAFSVQAKTIKLPNYDYHVHDIRERGLSKEELFLKMNRDLVLAKHSICSNRAHVWTWDFKIFDIESPKIFLFFTKKTGSFDGLSWWYHVVPMVNEGGKLWAMDAGYPSRVKSVLSPNEWMKTFNGKFANCKEIKNSDTELIRHMAKGGTFPEKTSHGQYDCYYRMTPPGYVTPAQVARNLLDPTYDRTEFVEDEVIDACIEASTTPLGWIWGTTLGRCRYFLKHGSLRI